ncbi:hypothetical protein [uncultured Ruminococcus sp.]
MKISCVCRCKTANSHS